MTTPTAPWTSRWKQVDREGRHLCCSPGGDTEQGAGIDGLDDGADLGMAHGDVAGQQKPNFWVGRERCVSQGGVAGTEDGVGIDLLPQLRLQGWPGRRASAAVTASTAGEMEKLSLSLA